MDRPAAARCWGPRRVDVPAIVTPTAYGLSVALFVLAGAVLCPLARRHPGPWRGWVTGILGALLLADAVSFIVALIVAGTFSARTSLQLALCDMAALVAAAACFTRLPVLVELTYF